MPKQLNKQVRLEFIADTKKAEQELKNLFRQLDSIGKNVGFNNLSKEAINASQSVAELKGHLEAAVNVDTGQIDFSKLNQSLKSSGQTLETYAKTLINMGPQGQKAFTLLTQSLSKAEIPLRKTNALANNLWTTLKNTAKWQISSSILHAFMGALQSAKRYAQDLNESLTNIRIVTGYSTDQMAAFAKGANEAARALSTTTTEYTNASLIFYQQGLSTEEVKKRTDVTIKMANAAGQSVEETSNQLTAIWNNFDNGTKSLEYYADVITALGAATASSTKEISGGLEKFAAIGEIIGLSYEYATAALATITSNTRQSEDVVGTALKTIFARIQGLNLGETLDDGTTLNKYSQALEKVGISIFDTAGNLKAMDSILDEMANKWNQLNSAQQTALAQTVAGVRQYNQLVSLMENWQSKSASDNDSMLANLATIKNSEGALQEQADIYAEGWEAAQDRVTAALEKIYNSILNSDFFIGVLKNTEKILGFVDNLIDGFGGLKGVIFNVGAILTKVFNKQLTQSLQNSAYAIKMMMPGAQQRAEQQKQAMLSGAIEWINQDNYGTTPQVAEATKDNLQKQLTLQSELNEKAKDLNETQKLILQNRIDAYNVLAEDVVKLAEAADNAIKNKDDALQLVKRGFTSSVKEGYKEQVERDFNTIQSTFDSAFTYSNDIANIELIRNKLSELQHLDIDVDLGLENDLTTSEQIKDALQKLYSQALQGYTDKNIGLFDSVPAVEEDFNNLAAAERQATDAQSTLTKSSENLNQIFQKLKGGILDAQNQSKSWLQSIVNATSVAFGLASAVRNVVGIIDVWNNQEMSAGERFLNILTSTVMIAPQVINSISSIAKAFGSWASAAGKTADAVATGTKATVDGIDAIPKDKIDAIVLLIAAIVAAIAGIGVAISSAKKKSEKELKEFKKRLDDLKTSNEELKDSIQGLEDTYATYTELKEKIDSCVKGTDEWTEAVTELKAVLSTLAADYPELKFEWGENGLEAVNLEKVLENEKKRLNNLQTGTYLTEILERQKEVKTAQEKYSQYVRFDRRSFLSGDLEGSTASSTISDVLVQFQDSLIEASKISDEELIKTLDEILKTQATFRVGESNSPIYLEEKLKREGITEDRYQEALSELAKGLIKHLKAIDSANEEEIEIRERNNKLIAELLGPENFNSTVLALTASEVDNIVEDIKTNNDYSAVNRFTSNDDIEDLWDEYNNKRRTNYELRGNAVRGKDGKTKIVYNDENGRKAKIPLDEVMNVVLSDEITTALEERAANLAKAFEEATLAGQDFALKIAEGKFEDKDGNTKFDLTDWVEELGETEYDALPKNLIDLTEESFKEFYETYLGSKYNLSYEDFIKSLETQGWALEEVLAGIVTGVQNVEDSFTEDERQFLADKNITGSAAEKRAVLNANQKLQSQFEAIYGEKIGQSLVSILDQVNITDAAKLEDFYLDLISLGNLGEADAISAFKELAETYDLTTSATQAFIVAMSNLKRVYNLSTISAEENAIKLKELLGDDYSLEYNEVINSETYDELSNLGINVQEYFTKMADGSYQLTHNAEEFNKIVKEINAQKFQAILDKINTVLSTVEGDPKKNPEAAFAAVKSTTEVDFSSIEGATDVLKYDTFEEIPEELKETVFAMFDLLQQIPATIEGQITSLATTEIVNFNELIEKAESLRELDNLLVSYRANQEVAAYALVTLAETYEYCTEALLNYKQALSSENEETIAAAEEELRVLMELEDEVKKYGLSMEEVVIQSEELAETLALETKAANRLAIQNQRMNKGVATLSENWEDWKKIIKSSDKTTSEYAQTAQALTDTIEDLIGANEDLKLPSEFFESAENLELIEEAAQGSAKATELLGIAIAKTQFEDMQMLPDSPISSEYFETAKSKVLQGIEELQQAVLNGTQAVGEGATGMGADWAMVLNDMARATNMTVEQMNAYLNELGVEAEVVTDTKTLKRNVPKYTTVTEVGEMGTVGDGYTYPKTMTTYTYQDGVQEVDETIEIAKINYGDDIGKPIKYVGNGNISTSSVKKPSGGGGGSAKKAPQPKKSDTVERYKEVNDRLDDVADNLKEIDALNDRLYGKEHLDNMAKSNELLAQEIELDKQKRQEAENYLAIDKASLNKAAADAGISFSYDANGNISNYTTEMTGLFNRLESLTNQANANGNVSESEQEAIDALQEKIDALKEAISQYDETRELITDLDAEIAEGIRKQQDTLAKMLSDGLTVELEFNDSQLEIIDYYLSRLENNVYEQAESAALTTSKLTEYQENSEALQKNQAGLVQSYADSNISQAAFVEGLQKNNTELLENLKNLKELDDTMKEYYANTLSAGAEKIDEFTSQMEHSSAVLEHYNDILELTGTSIDYNKSGQILATQRENAENLALTAKKEFDVLAQQSEARYQEWQSAIGTEQEDFFYQQYISSLKAANTAQEEYLNLAKDWAQAITDEYENAMASLAANLEDALTGGTSMEQLTNAMERVVSLQEEYLTTTNKIYETNKLMRTAQQAIDSSSNSIAKKRLQGFINETQALQNQSQLSEYELEIQQAKYDLLLAEIAMEEAQNAKSIVRLQQDSEGNFGYVYTADADAVEDAEDDLLAAENDLYNIGLRGANEYTEKYQQTMAEMYDELTQLEQKYREGAFASEQEYLAEVEAIKQYYYDMLENYSSLYGIALTTDSRVMADAWSTGFQDMTLGTEKWKDAVNGYLDEVKKKLTDYEVAMKQVANETVGKTLEDITEKTKSIGIESDKLAEILTKDGGIIDALNKEYDAVAKVTAEYAAQKDAIKEVIEAMEEMLGINMDYIETEKNKGLIDENKDNEIAVTPQTSINDTSVGDGATANATWDRILEGFNYINSGSWGSGIGSRIKNGVASGFTEEEVRKAQELINLVYGGRTLNEAKKILGFDVGGYTGDWSGNSGKLAFLHKRELVLNQDDTKNFLTGIGLLDKILQTIDLYAANAQFSRNLTSNFATANGAQALEQNVKIEALFPNVQQHTEIEEAFNNLILQASQYANR